MASSRRVTIEFLGDDKTASAAAKGVARDYDQVGNKLEQVGREIADGFDTMADRTGQSFNEIRDDLQTAESRFKSADLTLHPDVDTDRVESGIIGVVSDAEAKIKAADPTLTPDVDGGTAQSQMAAVVGDAESKAKAADPTLIPDVDGAKVGPGITGIVGEAEAKLRQAHTELTPTVDGSQVRTGMADVVSRVESITRSARAEITPTVDAGKVRSQMSGAVSSAESIAKASKPTITPEVDDRHAQEGMDSLSVSLKEKAKGTAAAVGAILAGGTLLDAISSEADVDKMAAALGLSDKQMERLGRVAGNVFANNWAASVGEAAEVVTAVMSSIPRMRFAGEEDLERISSKAAAFADIFDVDVTRAIQIAGQVMRTGLARNADQAFDLLFAASQKVPAAVREDLLDAIDEYGPFFRTIGLSGKETFDLLVQGAQKGMYGIDKTGDAIKEFTIRATDMSTSTKGAFKTLGLDADKMADMIAKGGDTGRKAFDKIITGLLGIEDPQKRANTAIALFGTPLEDLNVGEIPRFLKSLQGMQTEMGKVPGAADRAMSKASDNFGSDLQTMVNTVRLGAQNIITGFATGDWDRMGDGLKQAFGGLRSFIEEYWRSLLQFFGLLPRLIVSAIVDHWDQVTGFFSNAFDRIRDTISNAFDRIRDTVGNGVGWIRDRISDGFGRVREVVSNAVGAVVDRVTGAFGRVREIVGNAVSAVRERIGNAWSTIRDITGNAWSAVRDRIAGILQRIREIVSNVVGAVVGFFRERWHNIVSLAGGAMAAARDRVVNAAGRLKDAVIDKVGDVVGYFRDLPGKIKNALGNAGRILYGIGRAILQGLRDGIVGRWNDLRNWLVGLPSRIRGALGDVSKLLYVAGLWIIHSLYEGMVDKWNTVSGWVSDLKGQITGLKGPPAVDRVLLTNNGQLIMEGLLRGLQSRHGALKDMLTGFTNDIRTGLGDPAVVGAGVDLGLRPTPQNTQGATVVPLRRPEPPMAAGMDVGQPLVVQLVLDGKVIQESLVRLKRRNGGLALGIS